MIKPQTQICFILVLLLSISCFAQDIHFSQFNTSPVLLNPATAGASGNDYRLAINYKNQWKSVINPFKTAAIAFDMRFPKKSDSLARNFLGIGISLFNDKAGITRFTTNQVNIDLSYHVRLNKKNVLSGGIKSGLFSRNINATNLKWDNQFDGRTYDASRPNGEQIQYTNYNKFDLGAGLLLTHAQPEKGNRFQTGFSALHVTQPENSFYAKDVGTKLKYTGHFQAEIHPENTKFHLEPGLLAVVQAGHKEIVAGNNFVFPLGSAKDPSELKSVPSSVKFGAYYRVLDALIFIVALEYRKSMQFGLSYDVTLSGFTAASRFRGGPEFSFIYTGIRKEKKKKEKSISQDTLLANTPNNPAPRPLNETYQGVIIGQGRPIEATITIVPEFVNASDSAAVQHESIRTTSDSSGKYMTDLTSGKSYLIRIESQGYEVYNEKISIDPIYENKKVNKDFTLVPLTKTVETAPKKVTSPCGEISSTALWELKQSKINSEEAYQEMIRVLGAYCADNLRFKVQIGAYKNPSLFKYQRYIPYGQPEIIKYPDGITRITIGEFKTIAEANAIRNKIIQSGQKDSWIVSFENGKRMTLQELVDQIIKHQESK